MRAVNQLQIYISSLVLMSFALSSSPAYSSASIDIDLASVTNALTVPAVTTVANTAYYVALYGSLDTKDSFFIGPYYLGSGFSSAGSTTTTYSSADLGVALKWYIDRNHFFGLTVGYAYNTKGTYVPASGTSEAWGGTSLVGKISVEPEIGKSKNLGISILYYSATYTSKTIGTATTTVANANTYLVPALGFTFNW